MISAVRFMHRTIGLELGEALRMASLYPAEAMGVDRRHGRLGKGTAADFIHLSGDLAVRSVWIGGDKVFQQPQVRIAVGRRRACDARGKPGGSAAGLPTDGHFRRSVQILV